MTATFGAVLDSLSHEGDRWAVTIPKAWSNGRTVFGGLQVALSVRAMRVELRAEFLRSGRSATHARCDLLHEGTLACTTVAIFGVARPSRIALDIARPRRR
jgi:acyl-CoA thioesterase